MLKYACKKERVYGGNAKGIEELYKD